MEGVGSRLGRASSRYGPSAAANVFNGPVRKWKKKWVHVSPPPAANNNSSRSNGHHSAALSNNSSNDSSRLLLCRWTPLAVGGGAGGDDSSAAEEPPRRKFRYTPIAALEERKKAAKSVDVEVKESEGNQISESNASENDEPEDDDETMKEEAQDPDNGGTLDLGLCSKGQDNEDKESPSEHKEEAMEEAANSSRAWAFG
ncbi:unnamed protein product [Linum tenue]|uniref:Uncharacterized protein n=1 Tax=Linum tenue TaxID=586396 RepID=A0AAV0LSX1_9ROSI|nr:unnamed protein product [Linum tenue]